MLMELTEREEEINDCLVNGMSSSEPSTKFDLSLAALENHRKDIKKNLMDKIPPQLLSGWHEDNERFFDFGWMYHFAY